jgi:hypothetical protein
MKFGAADKKSPLAGKYPMLFGIWRALERVWFGKAKLLSGQEGQTQWENVRVWVHRCGGGSDNFDFCHRYPHILHSATLVCRSE